MGLLLDEIEQVSSEMTGEGSKIHEFACRGSRHHTTSFLEHWTAGRVIRRKAITAAAMATHPYSCSITQPGRDPHGRPAARKGHCTHVGIMLTVQMLISRVEHERRNASRQRTYR